MDTVINEHIRTDVVAAVNALVEARKEGRRTIDVTPQSVCPAETIKVLLTKIAPGERIRVVLPRCFTHFGSDENPDEECDWDAIGEITDEFCGKSLNKDIFLVVRHDKFGNNAVVDIYRHE